MKKTKTKGSDQDPGLESILFLNALKLLCKACMFLMELTIVKKVFGSRLYILK